MGYVGITKSFHGDDGLSLQGLGAASDADDLAIDYYASSSQLQWRSSSARNMHTKIKKMDTDWHTALSNMPINLIPDDGLQVAARAFMQYPMPIAAEIALALEVIWGGRPFDDNCVQVLLFARDRLFGLAGAAAGVAGTAGLVAGVMAFVPVDLGISAASLGVISGSFAASSVVISGLGGIIGSLAKGEAPKQGDLNLMMDGASAMTGQSKPGKSDQNAAIAALAARQDEEDVVARVAAVKAAKRASVRKRDACRARGGVFDPRAPDGCRVINKSRTEEKLRQKGIDVGGSAMTRMLVPAGLGALGIVGIYFFLRPKPRANPKPKKRRRRS